MGSAHLTSLSQHAFASLESRALRVNFWPRHLSCLGRVGHHHLPRVRRDSQCHSQPPCTILHRTGLDPCFGAILTSGMGATFCLVSSLGGWGGSLERDQSWRSKGSFLPQGPLFSLCVPPRRTAASAFSSRGCILSLDSVPLHLVASFPEGTVVSVW